jgi:hypothetical protein
LIRASRASQAVDELAERARRAFESFDVDLVEQFASAPSHLDEPDPVEDSQRLMRVR